MQHSAPTLPPEKAKVDPVDAEMAGRAPVVARHVLEVVIDRQIAEGVLLDAGRGRKGVQDG